WRFVSRRLTMRRLSLLSMSGAGSTRTAACFRTPTSTPCPSNGDGTSGVASWRRRTFLGQEPSFCRPASRSSDSFTSPRQETTIFR
ncbi:MAG: hypothetical protein AVDCRST_MAG72-965, partial [uncultured Nocardioidaceae bacterium]